MKGRKRMMKKRKWLVSLLAVVLTVTENASYSGICADCRTGQRGWISSKNSFLKQMKREGWSWSPDGEGGYTLCF